MSNLVSYYPNDPDAYLNGWCSAHRGEEKKNPYPKDSPAWCDFEKAYSDLARGVIDGPKALGKEMLR